MRAVKPVILPPSNLDEQGQAEAITPAVYGFGDGSGVTLATGRNPRRQIRTHIVQQSKRRRKESETAL